MFLWELGETCEESDDNLKYEQLERNFDDLHRNYQTLCKISVHRNKKCDDMEDVGYYINYYYYCKDRVCYDSGVLGSWVLSFLLIILLLEI